MRVRQRKRGERVQHNTNHHLYYKGLHQHHICPIYSLWPAFSFSFPPFLSLHLWYSHSYFLLLSVGKYLCFIVPYLWFMHYEKYLNIETYIGRKPLHFLKSH